MKYFSNQQLHTQPRFDTEDWGNSQIANSVFIFIFIHFLFFISHLYFNMQVNPKIPVEHDFLKDAKINPLGEKSVFYNSTNQFQQYYDNDDDNDNKQDKSKIAAPKNIKLPPTFRATSSKRQWAFCWCRRPRVYSTQVNSVFRALIGQPGDKPSAIYFRAAPKRNKKHFEVLKGLNGPVLENKI